MGNVAFTDWVHCDVVEILLEVEVVADHVIEESCLPETLFEEVLGFTFGQFFNSTTSGLKVARQSVKADINARDSFRVDLVTHVEGNMT
jgi:hypothetical protein